MQKKNIYILVILGIVTAIFLVFIVFKPSNGITPNQTASISGSQILSAVIGQKAPGFSLQDIDGKTVSLSGYLGKKNVVLFFTEGAMCYPACWDQMSAFAQDSRFNSSTTQAISVVVDTPQEWQQIESQTPEMKGADILFDTARAVSREYGVLNLPSSMHPGSFPGHTYFIVDKTGVIRYALDDPMMGIRNDAIWNAMQNLNL